LAINDAFSGKGPVPVA